jgi:succinylglutamate desuccinylase
MAKKKRSISELERLLDMQKKRVAALQKQRDQLSSRITRLDEEIAVLLGKPKAPKEVSRRRRRRKGKSLAQFVVEVLSQSPQPKSAAEIAEAVIAAGYRTSSKKPVAVVRQILYKSPQIQVKERGRFVLTSQPEAPRAGRRKKAAKK